MEDNREMREIPDSRDFTEQEAEYEQTEEDEVLRERIASRKLQMKRRRKRNKRLIALGIFVALVLMLTMCGRQVIRLKAENYSLHKQQEELIEERDRLQEELKNTGNTDYIKEQARKQLRLLDPGEIMFIFRDGEDETDDGE